MGPIGGPKTSALNHLTPRHDPNDGRIHFNRGGSLTWSEVFLAYAMKVYTGSTSMPPLSGNLDTHCTGRRVGPRARLDVEERRKISKSLAADGIRTPSQPGCKQVAIPTTPPRLTQVRTQPHVFRKRHNSDSAQLFLFMPGSKEAATAHRCQRLRSDSVDGQFSFG
jgi:hypothetical protein